MPNHRMSLCLFLIVAALTLVMPRAYAQECASAQTCQQCMSGGSIVGWAGTSGWGSISRSCHVGDWCANCYDPLISAEAAATASLVDAIVSTPVAGLRDAVEPNRERLFLYTPRKMLAVTGTCGPGEVEAVVFLSRQQVDELQRLGVATWDDFLSRQPAAANSAERN